MEKPRSWSAPLLSNQSDLVWRGKTESPLALTAERWGGGGVLREDLPLERSGAMRGKMFVCIRCRHVQIDTVLFIRGTAVFPCLLNAWQHFVNHSHPASLPPQVFHLPIQLTPSLHPDSQLKEQKPEKEARRWMHGARWQETIPNNRRGAVKEISA